MSRIGACAAAGMLSWVLLAGCSDDAAPGPEESAGRSCAADDPPTAGNSVIRFLGDVQQGRDPSIEGGETDPFGCAYDRLCEEQRDRVSEAELRSSRGEALSELLSADAHAGPSAYVDRGLAEAHPAAETLDPALSSTWVEVEAAWHADPQRTEHWRVDLVREEEAWRVCGFTRVE